MIVKDKVLKKEIFKPIQKLLMGNEFPWFYENKQVEKDSSFLFHYFHYKHIINSDYFKIIEPILNYLDPVSLILVRANLLLNRTKSDSNYHTDVNNLKSKTAIFYINTNNGYTEFYDGTKVDCVENRIVIFPSELAHKAVAQTDTDQRIVININYFENN